MYYTKKIYTLINIFRKHTGVNLVKGVFSSALWIYGDKPCLACMDSVLANLMESFHRGREKIPVLQSSVIYCTYSLSTCLCNLVTRNSPLWFNFCLSECSFQFIHWLKARSQVWGLFEPQKALDVEWSNFLTKTCKNTPNLIFWYILLQNH